MMGLHCNTLKKKKKKKKKMAQEKNLTMIHLLFMIGLDFKI